MSGADTMSQPDAEQDLADALSDEWPMTGAAGIVWAARYLIAGEVVDVLLHNDHVRGYLVAALAPRSPGGDRPHA